MKRTVVQATLTVFVFMLINVSCRSVPIPTPIDTRTPLPINTNAPISILTHTHTPIPTETFTPTSTGTFTPTPTHTSTPPPTFPPSTTWQDQIVYVLIPHKFYDGDPTNNHMRDEYQLPNPAYEGGFLGGDLAGIRHQMGYLKGLGISSVLLYPIFSNNEKNLFQYLPTGYSVRDYQTIDRNFGTSKDFTQLIADFHATTNGSRINIILDLPMAVTGIEHPWFTEPSLYPGYYRPWNVDNPSDNDATEPITVTYGMIDHALGGPIINHTQGMGSNTGVYREVRDEIAFWLVDHFDIDGFRYDSAHVFHATFWPKFMSDFRGRYSQTRPNFWHIAEVFIWPGTAKSWQVPSEEFINQTSSVGPIQMDGLYDFALLSFLQDVFARGIDPNCIPPFCASLLEHLVNPGGIEHPERLMAPLDGYESLTFLKAVENGNAMEKLYLASAFLMTINRVPLIYSGNEYGIDYTEPGTLFAGGLDQNYHENFKKLIQIRRTNAAFRWGSLTGLDTTSSILSYAREHEGQIYIVVLNNATVNQSIEINLGSRGISCPNVKSLLVENDQNIQLINAGNSNVSLAVTLNAWEPKIIQCE